MTVHFISGLPRSGSTILCNVLAQNPRFCVGGTSGLVDVILGIRNQWDHSAEFRAMSAKRSESLKLCTMQGAFFGYCEAERRLALAFSGVSPAIVFNKSRSWLGHLEALEEVLGEEVKVIVPVRDLRDILASVELLWRNTCATRQIPLEAKHYHAFQTLPGRCAAWMLNDSPVGIAVNRVLDAVERGFRGRLHFLHYEDFCENPRREMQCLHAFLDEKFFDYDFEHVKQVTQEDDTAYGMPGLHDIASRVEPRPSRWGEVLGETGELYTKLNSFLMERISDVLPTVANGHSRAEGLQADRQDHLR